MTKRYDPQKVLESLDFSNLQDLEQNEKTMRLVTETSPAVKKILDIYEAWDGDAETLDTDSFTWDELHKAIDDITEHEEDGFNRGIQKDNALSLLVTSRSMMNCILKIPRIKKAVDYI